MHKVHYCKLLILEIKIQFNFYIKFQLFTAPADFKPKNLTLSQTSSDCVRLDWDNPYTDVEANYQV